MREAFQANSCRDYHTQLSSVPWTGLILQGWDCGSRDVANTGGWNPVRGMLKNGEEIWMK